MAITFVTTPAQSAQSKKKSCGHTKAVAPTIPLDQPGRLRVSHLLSLLGVSHSTLYVGMKRGRYPKPDGMDGRMPYWFTSTIRELLKAQCQH